MESELQALEDRIREVTALAHRLRAENGELRQRVAALETDKKRLTDKVESAMQRLDSLLKQIPE